jgi:hypothetical protein
MSSAVRLRELNGGSRLVPRERWLGLATWGRVAADRLDRLADRTGFVVTEVWSSEGRWFGVLDRR